MNFGKQLAWLISTSKNKNFFASKDMAQYLFQGSRAVQDPDVLIACDHIKNNINHNNNNCLKTFETSFIDWLGYHSSNTINGLEKFKPNFSNGTTQAFDSFYLRHSDRRFKCFVGEYFYHLKSWISIKKQWEFINDLDDVKECDAVVVSAPFCDTGDVHPNYKNLLEICEYKNIPVLIDCCYYPISGNIQLDFNYKCIDTICFSLSKAFPVANYRIGIRYVRQDVVDGQSLLSDINYNNVYAASMGINLISAFRSDAIYKIYREKQEEICSTLPGLTTTNCSIFAIGDDTWEMYSRKNLLNQYGLTFDPKLFTNRICLTSIYENWDLYKNYAHTIKI
jgi:hypothetical protein